MKELFIECHEELVAEMMDANPLLSEDGAYNKAADFAYERMTDKLADLGDRARMIAKEQL